MSRPTAPDPAGPPTGLTAAIALSALGALLTAFAPLLGLVAPDMPAAFTSWPWLLVPALVPAVLAAVFRGSRPALAAAVLLGPAVLAPGRLVQDAQLLVDAGLAARPELLLPDTLDPLGAAPGTWVLLAGHLLALAAGVLALIAGRGLFDHADGASDAFGSFGEDAFAGSSVAEAAADGGSGRGRAGARRQGLLALVLCATAIAAVGLLMGPFTSDDPYLLAKPAVEAPVAVAIGSLLLAIAVPAAAGFMAGSADRDLVRGGLLGLAAGLAAVAVPPLVAVALLPRLHFGWGPALVLAAALVLVGLAVEGGRDPARNSGEVRLPALTRLLRAAGALALLAGALAVVGALTPHLRMPSWIDDPSVYPARLLWPGGVLLVLLGAALLVPSIAAAVRPALTAAWAALPLAGAAALDSVLTSTQVAGADAAPGAWASGAAMVFALLAAITAALAGGVEREEVDLAEPDWQPERGADVDLAERSWRPVVAVPAALAALLGLAAVLLPVLSAPDYTAPGVFTRFGTASWGLIGAGVAVLVATVLAVRSRPARAAALLVGAALVMVVRALEFPLTAGRAADATPGPGLWCAVAAAVVLLITALLAGRSAER
ncbi:MULTISPECIES: hypothetical protein [unclassified Saccharopolyspora]|uniref:hypothetical protein n=1 Tax=unclassified Saccharopolyspora TaxID=2646250 RepID=UPI001CD7ED95|nr:MULTISPECIES: hypothetical protein [unclassified Saccharopolyspora]MCA1190170.1 hypothetical protein [Saccharopolyspora sp. 6T]MCA1194548.1 hypothetical protein [Saccharopolyspora sp. 6V]MCA1226733.1 hypothetical protein [Saccharopolyspora sp. 6M]